MAIIEKINNPNPECEKVFPTRGLIIKLFWFKLIADEKLVKISEIQRNKIIICVIVNRSKYKLRENTIDKLNINEYLVLINALKYFFNDP